MENIEEIGQTLLLVILAVAIVDAVLKGFALWRAARKESLGWFIALLVFNTAGILPLIYLVGTKPEAGKNQASTPKNKPNSTVR